jgi:uncharacterized membrane protein YkvA (DUF1232 family)
LLSSLKSWAARLEKEAYALYLACRDPRTPWYAKALAAFVVAHTVSPIDLIPDFIPVLGYLDDLIITPLGLLVAIRLIPPEIMETARAQASQAAEEGRFKTRGGIAIVVTAWLVVAMIIIVLVLRARQK